MYNLLNNFFVFRLETVSSLYIDNSWINKNVSEKFFLKLFFLECDILIST